MRAFVTAVLVAIALAAMFAVILNSTQQMTEMAFSTEAVRLEAGAAAAPWKQIDLLAWANGLAAIFMFISWLGQNIFQNEMTSRNAQIQGDAQFINSEMVKVQNWLFMFQQERRKKKVDPEIILNSVVQYGETTRTIVEAARRIDPNSPVLKKHVDEHAKVMRAIELAATDRDLKDLIIGGSLLMKWFGDIGPVQHALMNRRAAEVSKSEKMGKWIFRGFFLLGSVVLAATWLKTNVALLSN
jgi:hypothetical protein